MIRFSAISLVFVLVFSSCALKTTQDLRQTAIIHNTISNPYFNNPHLDYVYKARVEVYKNHFSGIFIVKKTGTQSHRLVLTTDFGGKLLDLEYDGSGFEVNYVVDELKKPYILNVLKEDFRLLLTNKITISAAYVNSQYRVFRTNSDGGFNFYFMPRDAEKLVKIISTSKTKEKVVVDFDSSRGKIAETITIVHRDIKLKIELEKFTDHVD